MITYGPTQRDQTKFWNRSFSIDPKPGSKTTIVGMLEDYWDDDGLVVTGSKIAEIQKVKEDKGEERGKQIPDGIVLHHSYKPNGVNMSNQQVLGLINRAHARRVHGLQPDDGMSDNANPYDQISYHYVIFADGAIRQSRWETQEGRATKFNNLNKVHILIVGDFVNNKPTAKQYQTLNAKIAEIQKRWAIKSIKGHGQYPEEKTSCPGKNFDYMMVDQIKKWSTPSKTTTAIQQNTTASQQKANIKKRYSSVYVAGKADIASTRASYAYNKCMDHPKLGRADGYYGCNNMVLTFNSENRDWDPLVKGALNDNGTQDHGICQLNDQYHLPFITSKKFASANAQIDYCIEVWIDAKNKGKMPWAGYAKKDERGKNVLFQ